jgi:hypothetical protein
MLNKVLEKKYLDINLSISDSTDGAANMQGAYNGFSTKIMDHNSEHIHIWCYSHILNLILSDVLKGNLKASNLFTLINATAVFFFGNLTNVWVY